MSDVEWNGDEFVVDANLLSAAFDMPAGEIRTRMRDGQITSLCEAGQGEDEGRWRLTFRHGARALRLTVDRQGTVLGKSTFPVASRNAANLQRPRAKQGTGVVTKNKESRHL
ncbi:DUF6522 family protein [Maritimibacter sp. 55A14]|uniref:DUF6522 family protein n=1 Tax=Maritimibacter sp. 55A14 TaxID=2174844 RepID=UPI0018EE4E23|nr:DUF6522 family protein [Maritimibacter sp. 55A14]